jgi:hypothetical protein
VSSYTITVPDVPPSLNKVLRMHWAVKGALVVAWAEWIRACYGMPVPLAQGKMRVLITLHNSRQYDKDNAYGACKAIFDALKRLGAIVDDRDEWMDGAVRQEKSTRKDKHTVIEIGPA